MKSFSNFYSILPTKPYDAQKAFKTEVVSATGWNNDQFYKKMKGTTKISKLESEVISEIAKRFSFYFKLAREMSKEIDEYVTETYLRKKLKALSHETSNSH